jgi:hypothetical protein
VSSLAQILDPNTHSLYRCKAARLLIQNTKLRKSVDAFVAQTGFDDLEYLAQGTNSIVFSDTRNPNIVIRITMGTSEDERPVIPQLLQSIFSHRLSADGTRDTVKFEILPKLRTEKDVAPEEWEKAQQAYREELKASGYAMEDDDTLSYNAGLFKYTDPKNPRATKEVMIGADGGMMQKPAENKEPTCTSNYPTLKLQWREQQKLVKEDPRLSALLPEGRKNFPATKLITTSSYDSPTP